ncbi:MAG: hypothetical protein ACRDPY_45090, partial [Streptosporangiaceae bacterium]
EAEYPANQQVDDREWHPVSQPSPPPGRRGKRRSATESSIRAAQVPRPRPARLSGKVDPELRERLQSQPRPGPYVPA